MSWLTEWKAISAQIQGLLEASRFYIDSARSYLKVLPESLYTKWEKGSCFLISIGYAKH